VTAIVIELVYNHFPALSSQLVQQVDALCEDTAYRALRAAQIAIESPPKTGKIYRHGKHGQISHQASAPGEAPASDIGALSDNAKIMQEKLAMWDVLFYQEYAAVLEFGNAAGTLLPRPYLRPAIEGVRARFDAGMRKLGFS
jgi:hypothetical protein